jgi:hypothetical protein
MDRYSILRGKKYKKPFDWKGKKEKCLQILIKIVGPLYFLIRLDFWIMNHRLNSTWDKQLNFLMKKHQFRFIGTSRARAKLGDYVIWVENYPYAAFTCESPQIAGRPRRATILKAWKKLNRDQCDYDKSRL